MQQLPVAWHLASHAAYANSCPSYDTLHRMPPMPKAARRMAPSIACRLCQQPPVVWHLTSHAAYANSCPSHGPSIACRLCQKLVVAWPLTSHAAYANNCPSYATLHRMPPMPTAARRMTPCIACRLCQQLPAADASNVLCHACRGCVSGVCPHCCHFDVSTAFGRK